MAEHSENEQEQEENEPKGIVFKLPHMEQVNMRKDLTYKTADDLELKMDIYYPADFQSGSQRPAVIFIHGDAPPSYLRDIKNSEQYTGWGQLTAASGLIAVTFNHRSSQNLTRVYEVAGDIDDLIKHIRDNGTSLGIDINTLCLWVCSAGGPFGLRAAMGENTGFVKCIVSYYAFMDLKPYYDAVMESEERTPEQRASQLSRKDLEEFSAIHHLQGRAKEIAPILIARAGLDYPELNKTVDDFIVEALSQNACIDLMNHPEGQHGFDTRDDNARSREIIKATLEFMRTHLSAQ